MIRSTLVLLVFLLCFFTGASQDSKFIDLTKTTKYIDTLLIDRDLNNWSIRALGSFKEQRVAFNRNSNTFIYQPNNPYGVGVGIGTKKAIFDLSFNIKATEENPTERYDIVWSFFKKNHLFDFYFQHYLGFDMENDNTGEIVFREDVKSLSLGVRYMYMFNENEYSIAAMKTGLITADKSTFTFGLGGFLLHNFQTGNESIVPVEVSLLTNDNESVDKFKGTAIGVSAGFSSLIVLPKSFFVSFNVSPGVGLMNKYVTTNDSGFQPNNPLVLQLGASMILGYNGEQYYVNLAVSNGYYRTDYDIKDEVSFGYLNAKLAFGYKLKGKFKKNWKK